MLKNGKDIISFDWDQCKMAMQKCPRKPMVSGFLLLELLVALGLVSLGTLIIVSYHIQIIHGNYEARMRTAALNYAHSVFVMMRLTKKITAPSNQFRATHTLSPLAQPDPLPWIEEYEQINLKVIDCVVTWTTVNKQKRSVNLQTVRV